MSEGFNITANFSANGVNQVTGGIDSINKAIGGMGGAVRNAMRQYDSLKSVLESTSKKRLETEQKIRNLQDKGIDLLGTNKEKLLNALAEKESNWSKQMADLRKSIDQIISARSRLKLDELGKLKYIIGKGINAQSVNFIDKIEDYINKLPNQQIQKTTNPFRNFLNTGKIAKKDFKTLEEFFNIPGGIQLRNGKILDYNPQLAAEIFREWVQGRDYYANSKYGITGLKSDVVIPSLFKFDPDKKPGEIGYKNAEDLRKDFTEFRKTGKMSKSLKSILNDMHIISDEAYDKNTDPIKEKLLQDLKNFKEKGTISPALQDHIKNMILNPSTKIAELKELSDKQNEMWKKGREYEKERKEILKNLPKTEGLQKLQTNLTSLKEQEDKLKQDVALAKGNIPKEIDNLKKDVTGKINSDWIQKQIQRITNGESLTPREVKNIQGQMRGTIRGVNSLFSAIGLPIDINRITNDEFNNIIKQSLSSTEPNYFKTLSTEEQEGYKNLFKKAIDYVDNRDKIFSKNFVKNINKEEDLKKAEEKRIQEQRKLIEQGKQQGTERQKLLNRVTQPLEEAKKYFQENRTKLTSDSLKSFIERQQELGKNEVKTRAILNSELEKYGKGLTKFSSYNDIGDIIKGLYNSGKINKKELKQLSNLRENLNSYNKLGESYKKVADKRNNQIITQIQQQKLEEQQQKLQQKLEEQQQKQNKAITRPISRPSQNNTYIPPTGLLGTTPWGGMNRRQLAEFQYRQQDINNRNMSMYALSHALKAMEGVGQFSYELGKGNIDEYIRFQSAMVGVAKLLPVLRDPKTLLVNERFTKFRQGILDLSQTLPVSATDLAHASESASRLGVTNPEQIQKVVETGTKLGVAFGMTPEDVTKQVVKIANAKGIDLNKSDSLDKVMEFADAINYLDDHTAASGREIINFTKKAVQTAEGVKMDTKDVSAFGATLVSLGISADSANTGFKNLMTVLQTGPRNQKKGTEYLEKSGYSVKELTTLFKKNPTETAVAFIKRLNKLRNAPAGADAAAIVRFAFGQMSSQAIMALVNNPEVLEKYLVMARQNSKWWTEKEFQARQKNDPAVRRQLMENRINQLKIDTGEILMPVLDTIITKVKEGANVATPIIQKHGGLLEGGAYAGLLALGGLKTASLATDVATIHNNMRNFKWYDNATKSITGSANAYNYVYGGKNGSFKYTGIGSQHRGKSYLHRLALVGASTGFNITDENGIVRKLKGREAVKEYIKQENELKGYTKRANTLQNRLNKIQGVKDYLFLRGRGDKYNKALALENKLKAQQTELIFKNAEAVKKYTPIHNITRLKGFGASVLGFLPSLFSLPSLLGLGAIGTGSYFLYKYVEKQIDKKNAEIQTKEDSVKGTIKDRIRRSTAEHSVTFQSRKLNDLIHQLNKKGYGVTRGDNGDVDIVFGGFDKNGKFINDKTGKAEIGTDIFGRRHIQHKTSSGGLDLIDEEDNPVLFGLIDEIRRTKASLRSAEARQGIKPYIYRDLASTTRVQGTDKPLNYEDPVTGEIIKYVHGSNIKEWNNLAWNQRYASNKMVEYQEKKTALQKKMKLAYDNADWNYYEYQKQLKDIQNQINKTEAFEKKLRKRSAEIDWAKENSAEEYNLAPVHSLDRKHKDYAKRYRKEWLQRLGLSNIFTTEEDLNNAEKASNLLSEQKDLIKQREFLDRARKNKQAGIKDDFTKTGYIYDDSRFNPEGDNGYKQVNDRLYTVQQEIKAIATKIDINKVQPIDELMKGSLPAFLNSIKSGVTPTANESMTYYLDTIKGAGLSPINDILDKTKGKESNLKPIADSFVTVKNQAKEANAEIKTCNTNLDALNNKTVTATVKVDTAGAMVQIAFVKQQLETLKHYALMA